VEDPGYVDARSVFRAAGAELVPLPVDAEGACATGFGGARIVYVTPSHQYPTTATMTLDRRAALLAAAAEQDAVLVEDDYDTEMTFRGTPTVALKALDDDSRVVHVASFSKTLAPGLRLGFVIAPPALVAAMRDRARFEVRHPPGILQRTVAHLIASRDYARHVRRLRAHYRRRWEAMSDAVTTHFWWRPQQLPRGGMAVWVEGPPGLDADRLARAVARRGVLIEPGRAFFLREPRPAHHFRLGFQCVHESRVDEGVRRIARAVEQADADRPRGARPAEPARRPA
jgi:GntR family transcriptional regulator/MocR family aminotransferase